MVISDLPIGQAEWCEEFFASRGPPVVGRPTLEGAHRDGVDFVAVWLAARDDVRGGETRVFDAQRPHAVRFTMSMPGTAMVLDDHRVIHETTPILPGVHAGARDTLIVTYRAGAFQEP